MKALTFLLSLFLAATSAASVEIPVSPLTLSAAPGGQEGVRGASNGEISLVTWFDARGGTYATRVAADGNALDSMGIPLAGNGAQAVVWTGDEFLVISPFESGLSPFQPGPILTFVTTDGKVRLRQRLPGLASQLEVAVAHDRLLLVQPHAVDNSMTVLDFQGNVVAGPIALTPAASGHRNIAWAAGAGPSGFLLLRRELHLSLPTGQVVAERFDLHGRRLSTTTSGITLNVSEHAGVFGHENGWYVVHRGPLPELRYVVERLDPAGVLISKEVIVPPPGLVVSGAQIVREGNRHVLLWHTAPDQGHSYVYAAEVLPGSGLGEARRIAERVGVISDFALIAAGSSRLLAISAQELFTSSSRDVTAHALNERLEPGPRRTLSQSPTLQRNAEVAAGSNGYLTGWGENGPDRFARAYVRRFSPTGEPQDQEPLVVHQFEQDFNYLFIPEVRIVSAGDTYLVAWNANRQGPVFARRMSASSGLWLDPEPVQVGFSYAWTIGSNGSDALFVSVQNCAPGAVAGNCVNARRLRMTGSLVSDPPVIISSIGDHHSPVIASNGSDYLVAWSEGYRQCPVPTCFVPPYSLEAMRVRSDGVPLDAEPMLIESGLYGGQPAVAWDGSSYLLVWSGPAQFETQIRAARITQQGAVSGVDPVSGGTVIGTASGLLRLQAHGRSVILFAEKRGWSMTTIPFETPLDQIAALPRRFLVPAHDYWFTYGSGSLSSASHHGRLLVAYDRVGDGPATGVPRVFLRFPEMDVRRRAVSR